MKQKIEKIIKENDLSAIEIVKQLNETIEAQYAAKKLIAIALRGINRRNTLINTKDEIAEEVLPQHILIMGPTGTGKTEIFKRVSKILNKPMLIVTATQYTEIGYVGDDISRSIEELVTIAQKQIKEALYEELSSEAYNKAVNIILKILTKKGDDEATIEKIKEKLLNGDLNDMQIEIQVSNTNNSSSNQSKRPGTGVSVFVSEALGKIFSSNNEKKRKITDIGTAIDLLTTEEVNKVIDHDAINKYAIQFAENHGIIFIDEIDKLCKIDQDQRGGVSTKGVQRDLLALLSGTRVDTKYGTVNTNRILFAAAGAFHVAKPSDLMPELQGRLSIVVNFHSLSKQNLINILNNPIKGLIKQNIHLLNVENVELEFDNQAIERLAEYAVEMNIKQENIGARRLNTVIMHLMQELLFECSYDKKARKYVIDAEYVDRRLSNLINERKLEQYMI